MKDKRKHKPVDHKRGSDLAKQPRVHPRNTPGHENPTEDLINALAELRKKRK